MCDVTMKSGDEAAAATEPLEAAVFDMDGVVTRTARLHESAWKQLFDDYLRARAGAAGEAPRPFSAEDYRTHVDGRPRHAGIVAFLGSRGMSLPEGAHDDPSAAESVIGLGRRKNALFLELVEREGVEVDAATVRLVRDLRASGVRVGVATSSRNGETVLRRAGLDDLFDARVDGVSSAELDLRGKPAPDIFLECARRLGAPPARTLVVEDAASGVRAGHAGGFGLVIGVDRGDNWMRLREAGADWIVREMSEMTAEHVLRYWESRATARPNVLWKWARVEPMLRGRHLAVFLDYDGTLTPIVDRPELAILDASTRRTLQRLSRAWPTQIVSGRGVDDVRRLVGLDSLWYAGSHGFDIVAPAGVGGTRQIAPEIAPDMHAAADELRRATADMPGVSVEDKRLSVSVHYRLADEAWLPEIERAVEAALRGHLRLKKGYGKKVVELRPAVDWDKGKALLWLLESIGLEDGVPIYVGDDLTDEDAFAAISARGIGILVTEHPRPTGAHYSVQNPFEVRELLERLALLGEATGS